MNAIYPAAALALFTVALFAALFRRLVSPARLASFNSEWLNRFSMAKYKPMERLLLEDDYCFLASQSGCDPRLIRRLRAERRGIFRQYLGCLKRDFHRLDAAARVYLVHCAEDKPELAKALLRQRVVFSYAVLVVEWRFLLHGFGLATVDVRALLAPLDAMREQLGRMALAQQAAGA